MKTQPILIDLDGTEGFLFVVRIRGVLCQAIDPARGDMSLFDQRITRADHPDSESVRSAVGRLARVMVEAMFAGDAGWDDLHAEAFKGEPLSRYECVVLVQTFLGIAAQARGEDPRPFVDGSFSLIAEDDGVTKARASAAAHLPPGRTIGAPSEERHVAPQPEPAAATPTATPTAPATPEKGAQD